VADWYINRRTLSYVRQEFALHTLVLNNTAAGSSPASATRVARGPPPVITFI
jgi:hypothetical protein